MNTLREIRESVRTKLQSSPQRWGRSRTPARALRAPLSDRAWMRGPDRRATDGWAECSAEAG